MDKIKETGKSFMHRSDSSNFFPTPYSMTEQLFEKEFFNPNGSFLEPACGICHMAYVLYQKFKNLEIYDIENEEFYGDFYKEKRTFDYIITNPPYGSETDKFVEKAKQITKYKFAFLLRTNYLSGNTRFKKKIYDGLKNVYIFTRMSDLRSPIRDDGKYKTAGIVYSWLVWETGYTGKPVIDWIDNQKFVVKKGELDD